MMIAVEPISRVPPCEPSPPSSARGHVILPPTAVFSPGRSMIAYSESAVSAGAGGWSPEPLGRALVVERPRAVARGCPCAAPPRVVPGCAFRSRRGDRSGVRLDGIPRTPHLEQILSDLGQYVRVRGVSGIDLDRLAPVGH